MNLVKAHLEVCSIHIVGSRHFLLKCLHQAVMYMCITGIDIDSVSTILFDWILDSSEIFEFYAFHFIT